MSKKTLYRTVIRVEILSENPFESNDLESINHEIHFADCSEFMEDVVRNQKIVGKRAINLLKNHATDPAFFNMDEEGNDCDED